MSCYVFLTPELGNMGGAQMFTNNKVAYLKKQGWNVQVFYYKKGGDIKLPELLPFRENFIKDFRSAFYYVPKWYLRKISRFISEKIGNPDEIVIESHLVELAYWGEALAKQLGARHICNFLEEQVEPLTEKKADFFEYKLKHWELMNSSESSQRRLFKGYYKSDFAQYANTVHFVCSNVVTDEKLNVEIHRSDFTILTIGRLDKPYVQPMTERIRLFVSSHPEKTYNVIYVGGSPDGNLEKSIPLQYKNLSNVHVYMLGYTFPVPSSLLDLADVGIACANSVLVTADYNIPTICVDMNDHYAIGVYGYSTNNNFARRNEPQIDVAELLDDVLIKHCYPPKEAINVADESAVEFKKQLDYLNKSHNCVNYYNVYSLQSGKTILWANIKWYVRRVIDGFNSLFGQ